MATELNIQLISRQPGRCPTRSFWLFERRAVVMWQKQRQKRARKAGSASDLDSWIDRSKRKAN
jgi:hypothetical protein